MNAEQLIASYRAALDHFVGDGVENVVVPDAERGLARHRTDPVRLAQALARRW